MLDDFEYVTMIRTNTHMGMKILPTIVIIFSIRAISSQVQTKNTVNV